MAITLRVTSYKNRIPSTALSVTIIETECSIGRAVDNSFVLPDSERIVSNRHAVIQFENGAYYVSDLSTNGTFINNGAEPIGQDKKVLLHDGDFLSIGDYKCAVSIGSQQIGELQIGEQQPAASSSGLRDNPIWQPALKTPAERIEPTWGMESFPEPEPAVPAQSGSMKPGASVDQDFFRPPEAIPEDWDALTGMMRASDLPIQPRTSKPPVNPRSSAIQPASTKPPIAHPKRATPPPKFAVTPPLKTPRNTGHLEQQAIESFLTGAGLTQVDLDPAEIVNFMGIAGETLREITQGYRQLLSSRASVKGEFRLGMTTIRPAENNPLKFSVDAEDAVAKLLLPPSKGFLPPLEAIQEATDDLQAHQMAVMAGLRAALSSLVAHFDPQTLEKEFNKNNLLPFNRVSNYWKAFKIRYKQAAADAENDFLHLLGDEFAIAYEQQIQRLKSARDKNKL